MVVFELNQAAVADGDPEDVRGEILDGRAAIADRFAVDNPLLLPDSVRDIVGQAGFLKGVVELGLEDSGERFDWQQEVMVGRHPGAMIGRQSTRRDEIVNVGMVGQVASPGMQDPDQAELSADKTRVLCQKLRCIC